jgi:ABC-type uncharacterized transport system permease subunit
MNFIGTLFDFSFSEFIATKVAKVLYGIILVLLAAAALAVIVVGFTISAGAGFATLIVMLVLFLIYLSVARMWLETVIAIFRIADRVDEIAGQKDASA